jgi:hypothetical protein
MLLRRRLAPFLVSFSWPRWLPATLVGLPRGALRGLLGMAEVADMGFDHTRAAINSVPAYRRARPSRAISSPQIPGPIGSLLTSCSYQPSVRYPGLGSPEGEA